MTPQILLMLVLLLVTLVVFVREVFPIEVTALGLLAILLASGLLTFDQAIAGFNNKAVIAIGGLFVLSHALMKTGFLEVAADQLSHRAGDRKWLTMSLMLVIVALLSGFLNNTAVVAIFIPLMMNLCRRLDVSPSKVMIPLSYATIFGGTLTLIGTSTNLLVSSIAEGAGAPPFSMFEFSQLGAIYLVIGLTYVLLFARRLLPARSESGFLTQKYLMGGYLTEVRVVEASKLLGRTCTQARVSERFDTTVLAVLRGDERLTEDPGGVTLQRGDILMVQGSVDSILRLRNELGLALLPDIKLRVRQLSSEDRIIVEGLLTPTSSLVGRTLKELDFRRHSGAFVLAIRRLGSTLREKIAHIPLHAADLLLMLVPRDRLRDLRRSDDLVVISELKIELHRERFWWLILLMLPLLVVLAALGVMDIAESALLGAILLLLVGAIRPQEAYRSVEWSVIFMIAAFIPVGQAIISTGTAEYLASGLLAIAGFFPPEAAPRVALALIYLVTSLLTQMISNNAAAIIVAPLSFSLATALGVDSRPFLIAVCFAASAEFMTPMGYQTNMMVYGPGAYRFFDYTRFGAPLNLIFWLIAAWTIPIFWPF